MHLRSVIAISVTSLATGYLLRFAQQRIAGPSFPEPSKEMNAKTMPIYELDEVQARREELDEQTITVVGGVCMRAGLPCMIPDDDVALLKDTTEQARYYISLPEWRFRDIQGVNPGIVVTGRFGYLGHEVGFDSLSPIDSVSWDIAPRGRTHDSVIDDEEYKRIEAEQGVSPQSATRSESNFPRNYNPQPESKPRSR